MAKKKRRTSHKNKIKKDKLYVKALLSLFIVIFSLIAANLSFMSFARDTIYTAVTKDMDFNSIKDTFSVSITAIKEMMKDEEKEKDNEIINEIPPEMILPEL